MSKYTTELRFICESLNGLSESADYDSVEDIIETARTQIFDFDYPIFDSNYKATLETKIIKHYYTREICAETYGLWKLFLNSKMNEIMPYYNKLYESELIEFNPLIDSNYVINNSRNRNENSVRNGSQETTISTSNEQNVTGSNETQGNSISNNNGTDWNLFNDTPQGGLDDIDDLGYLTNATKQTSESLGVNTDTSKGSNTQNTVDSGSQSSEGKNVDVGNINSTDKYIENLVGKRSSKSYSQLLTEFRNTFLNIDLLIIKDLNDLFFNLF